MMDGAFAEHDGAAGAVLDGGRDATDRVDAVVVGGGPAGFKLARALSRRGVEVALLNAESWAPYNRVKLTPLLAGEVNVGQVMQPRDPVGDGLARHYADCCAAAIHPAQRLVETTNGRFFAYRQLALCTGSHAFRPAIPGADARNVFTFRDADDTAALRARSLTARRVAVIGGGLLGLEAARAMAGHGAAVTVVEHETRLMPRQLDENAAALVATALAGMGVACVTGARVAEIKTMAGAVAGLRLADGATVPADTVVICAGVRPNVALAQAAGLTVRRGVVVDAAMRTSDPAIFAAGECAERDGCIEGLVGPCMEQADVAARAMCGEAAAYVRAPASTRLKVVGVDVISVGPIEALEEQVSAHALTWRDEAKGLYRRVFLQRGRLAGAIAVGDWPDAARVQQAVVAKAPASALARRRFRREGMLWPVARPRSAADLPAAATICNCTGVNRGRIGAAVLAGADSLDMVRLETGASTVCGSCAPLIEEILEGGAAPKPVRLWKALAGFSAVAALLALITLLAPRVPFPDSFEAARTLETLWIDNLVKQWSGYVLLGLTVAAAALGLRKRLGFTRRLGGYDWWRVTHLGIGGAAAVALFAHTGFRFGAGLSMALMGFFVAALLLGAVAGLATGGEHRLRAAGVGAADAPPRILPTWLHIIALWPLPVLLIGHILSVYAY